MKSYPWAFLAFAILLVTYSHWKSFLMDRYTIGLVTDVKPSAGMDTGFIYNIAFPDQNGDVVNGYFYDYKHPEKLLHKKLLVKYSRYFPDIWYRVNDSHPVKDSILVPQKGWAKNDIPPSLRPYLPGM